MKLLVLAAVGALTVGVVYHEEISDYFEEMSDQASDASGGLSQVNAIQDIGQGTSNMFGQVGNALDR